MSQSHELRSLILISLVLILGYLLQDAWQGGDLYTYNSALFFEFLFDLHDRISNLCAERLMPVGRAFIILQIIWLLIYLDLLKLKKELAKDAAKLLGFYRRDRQFCLTGLRLRYAPLMKQAIYFQSVIARKERALIKAEIEMKELEMEIDRIVWSHIRNLRASEDPNWIYLPALCYGYNKDPGGDRVMMNELTLLNEMRNNQIQELIWRDVQRIMMKDKSRDSRKRKHRSDRLHQDVNLGRFQTEILGRPGTPAEPLEALMTLEEMKRATRKRTVMPEEKLSKRTTKNSSCFCNIVTDQPIPKERKHRHRSKKHKLEDSQKQHNRKKSSAKITEILENERSLQICNLSTSSHNFYNNDVESKMEQIEKEICCFNRPSRHASLNSLENDTVLQEFMEIHSTDTIQDQINEDPIFLDGIMYKVEMHSESEFATIEPFGIVLEEEIDNSRMHQEYRTAILDDPKNPMITGTKSRLDFLVDISGDSMFNDYVNVIEARSSFSRSLSDIRADIPKSPSPRRSVMDISFSGNELLSYTPISKHRIFLPDNTCIINLDQNILNEIVAHSKEHISSQSSPLVDNETTSQVKYSESILFVSESEIPLGEGNGTLDFSSHFDDVSIDEMIENASSVTSITIYTDNSVSMIDICEFGLDSNEDLRQDQVQMTSSDIEIEENDYSDIDDRNNKNVDELFGNFSCDTDDLVVLWKEKSDHTKTKKD